MDQEKNKDKDLYQPEPVEEEHNVGNRDKLEDSQEGPSQGPSPSEDEPMVEKGSSGKETIEEQQPDQLDSDQAKELESAQTDSDQPEELEPAQTDSIQSADGEATSPSQDQAQAKEEGTSLLATFLSVIGNVLFSLFLILLISIISLNVLSFAKGEPISFFGKTMYIVGENTIAPIIEEEDAIIVEEKASADIQNGDLIVYETVDGEIVTAWVTDIMENDKFEIKKDINSDKSIVIDGIALIGVATLTIANMGEFIRFISNPFSVLLILLLGIMFYIVVWSVSNMLKRRS